MTEQPNAPTPRRVDRCLLIGDTTTTVPMPAGWLAVVVSPAVAPTELGPLVLRGLRPPPDLPGRRRIGAHTRPLSSAAAPASPPDDLAPSHSPRPADLAAPSSPRSADLAAPPSAVPADLGPRPSPRPADLAAPPSAVPADLGPRPSPRPADLAAPPSAVPADLGPRPSPRPADLAAPPSAVPADLGPRPSPRPADLAPPAPPRPAGGAELDSIPADGRAGHGEGLDAGLDGLEGLVLLGAGDDAAAELAGAVGLPVFAPDGPVWVAPGGMLFAPGGWWRHTPGGRRVAAGPRWPAPAWQSLLPEHTQWPLNARPIPAGWLLSAGDSATDGSPLGGAESESAPRLADAVSVDPERPRLLLDATVNATALAAALRALPPAARIAVEVVPLAPGQGAGRAAAFGAASELGEAVRLVNGVPLHSPSGDAVVYALDGAGLPVWAEPAWLLLCHPGGREEVLASSPPQPALRPVGPATYAMELGWLVRLSGGGLTAEPSGPLPPARGRAEVPAPRSPEAAGPQVVELTIDLSPRRAAAAATPEPLSATTPEPPSARTLQPPPATTLQPPPATTLQPPPAAAPQPAMTSQPAPATTQQPPPAAALEPLSATARQPLSATRAEAPSAASAAPAERESGAAFDADGRYRVVVGTAGLEINDLLWPPVSALFTAVLTDIPAIVDIRVAGDATPWGLAAARELAERHPGDAAEAAGRAKAYRAAELLPATAGAPAATSLAPKRQRRRVRLLLAAACVVVLVLLGVGVAVAWARGGDDDNAASGQTRAEPGLLPGALGGASATGTGGSAPASRAAASGSASAKQASGSPSAPAAGASAGRLRRAVRRARRR
ncbi:hypothetical protein [Dactylosporangium darangshiense]|uniref:hypothetical protein n=1 Tax=Dactylosporangium darangshiense TaxID=579108 RepID=UPI003635F29A